ncbi:major histocompatibility complex class I-related gene protein-like isoform X2 [Seriola lalandi dorsalis]|uniref:major histocompatibility complex class I-related gene protein-like isoform X2 n=1 Tax=Seriola lalandi dorsalis TaxID=1841481 RepID=UPI000C6FBAEA|nr:major histocompatibility complex class I-related gene protein-like isoform X2 [Seriola lalandi dorsalis]
MEKLFLLLLLCLGSSAVKHSLKYVLTASSGDTNLPPVVSVGLIDDIQAGYCDKESLQPRDWVKNYLDTDPQQLESYKTHCHEILPNVFKAWISNVKQRLNQSDDVHILQRISGLEWDDETGEVVGFLQFGYDGEDFISLDLNTLTWVAPNPLAVVTKLTWDADKARIKHDQNFLTRICPARLQQYLDYGRSSLQRTELPSVSLLQKTPSSPVSCHATGFYPHRAVMFWRKDGEDLHEDVDQGEILPNHDETFQMSVDLDISSVTPEDWRRYDCVFQLSGVKEDVVTKLDKAEIKTNEEKPSNVSVSIITAVVALTLVLIAVTGFMVYKKKKAKHPPLSPDSDSELSEKLNEGT